MSPRKSRWFGARSLLWVLGDEFRSSRSMASLSVTSYIADKVATHVSAESLQLILTLWSGFDVNVRLHF